MNDTSSSSCKRNDMHTRTPCAAPLRHPVCACVPPCLSVYLSLARARTPSFSLSLLLSLFTWVGRTSTAVRTSLRARLRQSASRASQLRRVGRSARRSSVCGRPKSTRKSGGASGASAAYSTHTAAKDTHRQASACAAPMVRDTEMERETVRRRAGRKRGRQGPWPHTPCTHATTNSNNGNNHRSHGQAYRSRTRPRPPGR
jgi:hypothetical protein